MDLDSSPTSAACLLRDPVLLFLAQCRNSHVRGGIVNCERCHKEVTPEVSIK